MFELSWPGLAKFSSAYIHSWLYLARQSHGDDDGGDHGCGCDCGRDCGLGCGHDYVHGDVHGCGPSAAQVDSRAPMDRTGSRSIHSQWQTGLTARWPQQTYVNGQADRRSSCPS